MAKLIISDSVGIGGKNSFIDVKAVQIALNRLLRFIPRAFTIKEDGSLGTNPATSDTVAAIKLFQQKVVGMVNPDGRIDINGRTQDMINSTFEIRGLANLFGITHRNNILPFSKKHKCESSSLPCSCVRACDTFQGRVSHSGALEPGGQLDCC